MEKNKIFNIGDKVTYKATKDLPHNKYYYGGSELGGRVETIVAYEKWVPEKNCYQIRIRYTESLTLHMLECEFEEYTEALRIKVGLEDIRKFLEE